MTALNRKLFRDLLQMKGQVTAIMLVIACGVATFVMSLSTLESLRMTQQTYYERYRFAHAFASLKRAPNALAARIAAIPGVAQVQTRIVVDVTLDVAGMAEPAVGRLISLPERPTSGLNALHLRSGRFLEAGRGGEILASEAFALGHNLSPGDHIVAVINGKLEKLTIVGVVLSPEYVMQMGNGAAVPDDKHFGVFWIGERELEAAFDLDGAFNSVTLSLMRGASEPEVLKRLDLLIEPYGGVGSYGREDQLSNRFLSDEIRQLRGIGMVAPAIFLSVAAFLLNMVLTRVISTQREQIAALKAFGYSRFEVGMHYLLFVLVIVFCGTLVGTAVGAWLGKGMTHMYSRFYRFPVFFFRFDVATGLMALGVSVSSAVLGAFGAVQLAVRLPPAEAMRPEPPATFRKTIVETLGLAFLFSQSARMIFRQLERRPWKSILSSFGIALATAVLVLGNFGRDALDRLMDFQFSIAQRQDVSIAFVEPTTAAATYAVGHLPGVTQSETYRSTPVRIRFGHRSRRLGIMGLHQQRDLFRLLDVHEKSVVLPDEGVVLSEKLAEILHVGIGEKVIIEVMEGQRPVREVPVTGIVTEFAGTNAYMEINALRRLLREQETVSGAFLAVDSRYTQELYRQLKTTPRVASVSITAATLQGFKDTIAENQLQMQMFNVIFACIIAFGVVYNTARISLSERSRELATLRVIGFTRAEVSGILLGELAVLTLVAIPLGLVMGYGFAALTVWAFETEMYRIPLVVSHRTFAFASAVTILASLLSGLVVRRRIDQLDLVAVLKSKE
ncbi:MAG: FtsX-like permease family protein [Planctomycetaceae bacterium]